MYNNPITNLRGSLLTTYIRRTALRTIDMGGKGKLLERPDSFKPQGNGFFLGIHDNNNCGGRVEWWSVSTSQKTIFCGKCGILGIVGQEIDTWEKLKSVFGHTG